MKTIFCNQYRINNLVIKYFVGEINSDLVYCSFNVYIYT